MAEIDHGEFKLNIKPRELRPIKEYLEPQRRFRHLSDELVEVIQGQIKDDWESYLMLEKAGKLPWY